jgi:hypothetical protein
VTLRGRVLLLAAAALCAAASAPAQEPAPDAPVRRWKKADFGLDAELRLVHESNVFHVQRRHEAAFATDTGPYERFHRMRGPDDMAARLTVDLGWRWKHESKRWISAGLRARALAHRENEIADSTQFRVETAFGVTRDDTIRLTASHEPEHFRKNSSREAFPGIVVFERADESRTELELRWEHEWSRRWTTTLALGRRRRDFAEPFDARDEVRRGFTAAARWSPVKRLDLDLSWERRRGRTGTEVQTQVSKDRSYDEDVVGLDARVKLPRSWRVTLSAARRTRDYVTEIVEDASRHGRTDHRTSLAVGAEKRFHGPWSLSFDLARTDQRSGREIVGVPSRDLGWSDVEASVAVGFRL